MAALLVFYLVGVLVIAHGEYETTPILPAPEYESEYKSPDSNEDESSTIFYIQSGSAEPHNLVTTGNKEVEESQNSQNQAENNSTPLIYKEEKKSTTVTNSENVSENNQRSNTPNEVNKRENNVLKERGNTNSNNEELKNKAEVPTALSHDERGKPTTVTNSDNVSKKNQRSNPNTPNGVNNGEHNTSKETANTNSKDQEFHNASNKAQKSTTLNHKEERKTTTVMNSKNFSKTNRRPYNVNYDVYKGENKNTSITSMTNNNLTLLNREMKIKSLEGDKTKVLSNVYESNDKFTTIIKTKHSSDSNIASSTYTNSAKGKNYNKREVNDILNKTEKLGNTVVLATSEYNSSLSSPNTTKTTKTKTKTNLWGTFKNILIGTVGVIGFLSWGMYIVMSVL